LESDPDVFADALVLCRRGLTPALCFLFREHIEQALDASERTGVQGRVPSAFDPAAAAMAGWLSVC